MAIAALISVTPLLAPSLSMSWTSRTRISSLTRGPSLAAGCGSLMGRRMGAVSLVVANGAKIGSFCLQVNDNARLANGARRIL
jgi:hypothetical protein